MKNMHDAIKPDLTMFFTHYETLEEKMGKRVVAVSIQEGNRKTVLYCKERLTTGRGFMFSRRVFFLFRQQIRQLRSDDKKKQDGDHFEEMRQLKSGVNIRGLPKRI
ncbi:MAG: hypothetical protein ACLTS6_20325 [Anaerobutyricum sp.]